MAIIYLAVGVAVRPAVLALQLIQMTLIVVTLSILVHGISVKPLMAAVWRRT